MANQHVPVVDEAFQSSLNRMLEKLSTKPVVVEALAANDGGDYAEKPKRSRKPRGENRSQQGRDLDDMSEEMETPETPIYSFDPVAEEALRRTPVAFIEPHEVVYEQDHMDNLLPGPGFITDFINTSRGMEVPTLLMLWGAIWTLSTMLGRHAWLKWYPKKLWPNMYILVVAPPGLCKKSTALDVGQDMIPKAIALLPSNLEQFRKQSVFITGKATSDGILGSLAPEERIFLNPEASTIRSVNRGSKASFVVGELTQLLNKQQYNVNLVTTLTNLYDCKDEDSEITRARGKEPLKDIYVTFIGATTPSNIRTSLPEEALGGGFLSRTVTVFQDVPTKIYSIPRALDGYPTPDELVPRLAWIAHHAVGEYELSPEAFTIYDEQYRRWKDRIFNNVVSEVSGETRYDVILLKLAMLIRVAEYRKGNQISADNIRSAIRILDYTISGSKAATEDIGMNDYARWMNTFKRMMERRGSETRARLQRSLSARGCKVSEFDMIVSQLVSEDRIIITLNGSKILNSQRNGAEVYTLTPFELERLRKEPKNDLDSSQQKREDRADDDR